MSVKHDKLILFLALAFVIAVPEGLAQSTKVELSGTVRDPAELPVQGADVRLMNTGTDVERSVSTDADGRYHFIALSPGEYAITISRAGFARLRRDGLVLRVGDHVVLDLSLPVGNITDSVNVTASTPLLQSTRGTVSFVV